MPVLKYRPDINSPWQVVGITGRTIGMYPQIIATAPTAPSGSTVTCSKGSIVLNAEEVDGTWTFNVSEYGEWNVTITSGLIINSITVLVDAVAQYNIELDLKLWLYKDGDECINVTGGWVDGGDNGSNFGSGFLKESDCLVVKHPKNGAKLARTVNQIDVTPYTKLYVEFDTSIDNNSVAVIRLQTGTDYSDTPSIDIGSKQSIIIITSIDISELTGSYYIKPGIYYGTSASFYKIWLE